MPDFDLDSALSTGTPSETRMAGDSDAGYVFWVQAGGQWWAVGGLDPCRGRGGLHSLTELFAYDPDGPDQEFKDEAVRQWYLASEAWQLPLPEWEQRLLQLWQDHQDSFAMTPGDFRRAEYLPDVQPN